MQHANNDANNNAKRKRNINIPRHIRMRTEIDRRIRIDDDTGTDIDHRIPIDDDTRRQIDDYNRPDGRDQIQDMAMILDINADIAAGRDVGHDQYLHLMHDLHMMHDPHMMHGLYMMRHNENNDGYENNDRYHNNVIIPTTPTNVEKSDELVRCTECGNKKSKLALKIWHEHSDLICCNSCYGFIEAGMRNHYQLAAFLFQPNVGPYIKNIGQICKTIMLVFNYYEKVIRNRLGKFVKIGMIDSILNNL